MRKALANHPHLRYNIHETNTDGGLTALPMDGMTLGFVARELNAALTGGRIDRITQPERDTVILLIRVIKSCRPPALNLLPMLTA